MLPRKVNDHHHLISTCLVLGFRNGEAAKVVENGEMLSVRRFSKLITSADILFFSKWGLKTSVTRELGFKRTVPEVFKDLEISE